MRVLLQAVFTDLGATLGERNLTIAKGESLVMDFSSIDLRTIKLWKEVDTSISLYVSANVSGWDLLGNLFGVFKGVFFFFFLIIHILISFSSVLCSTTHHGV